MTSYTYEYSSAYGGDEINTKELIAKPVAISADGLQVKLEVEGLRAGYVHELRLDGAKSVSGESLENPDAYYTLNCIPKK